MSCFFDTQLDLTRRLVEGLAFWGFVWDRSMAGRMRCRIPRAAE